MKRVVALEVSSDFIRAVELENPLTAKPKLIRYGEMELPEGAAGESEVFDIELVQDAIQEFWKAQKFSTKDVILGVGSRKILIRDYETQVADLPKIRTKLKFEAANLLPAQMGNAVLDFYPTQLNDAVSGLQMVQGLLIAAPVEPIEKIIAVAQGAGLEVQGVDYLQFGIARVARKAFGAKGEYLLVNVKSNSTDIIAMKFGIPQMVRIIPNGLTTRPEKAAGRHAGDDSSASFDTALPAQTSDPVELIIGGLRNTLNFYANKGGNPTALLLAGEGALSTELQERLPQALQIRTALLDMSNAIEVDTKKSADDPVLRAAALSVLGVGMRGLKD
jgi:type IV pilus assembly protein PilM